MNPSLSRFVSTSFRVLLRSPSSCSYYCKFVGIQISPSIGLIQSSRALCQSSRQISTTDTSSNKHVPTAPHFKTSETRKKRQAESEIDAHKQDASSSYGTRFNPYTMAHPIWSENELDSVEITHRPPDGFVDWLAFIGVKTLRFGFDTLSGFSFGKRNEKKWINRIIFLETVAGVPGMVAAMTRHLHSLRRLKRDYGWIHTLLEEAENERMHLISALMVKKPSWFFRGCVLLTQGIFVNMFFVAYLISPRLCHRFVGYLEEEAVITYTKLLKDIDDGALPLWENMPAPDVAVAYWKLENDANMRDMFRAIRADEAHHREVNHTLSSLKQDEENPFPPGQ